jgi:hypothetical protein
MRKTFLLLFLVLSNCSTDLQEDLGPAAYVDVKGFPNSDCSIESPCSTIKAALATNRPLIYIHGTIHERVLVDNKLENERRKITILGNHAIITANDFVDSPLMTIKGNVDVTIRDVTFSDVHDSRVAAIDVPPSGSPSLTLIHVDIENNLGPAMTITSGNFVMTRSTIMLNVGGGVYLDGATTYQIVGNLFYGNGGFNEVCGALSADTYDSPQNVIAFNTFVNNFAAPNIGSAIDCLGTVVARNNIVYANGYIIPNQLIGCYFEYNLLSDNIDPVPGVGNIVTDEPEKLFIDFGSRDFHPTFESPAIGAADPNADLTGLSHLDLDDLPRTSPATVGAYQF